MTYLFLFIDYRRELDSLPLCNILALRLSHDETQTLYFLLSILDRQEMKENLAVTISLWVSNLLTQFSLDLQTSFPIPLKEFPLIHETRCVYPPIWISCVPKVCLILFLFKVYVPWYEWCNNWYLKRDTQWINQSSTYLKSWLFHDFLWHSVL